MLVALFGCARGAAIPMIRGYDANVADGVQQLRAATQAFHSLDSAVAAGYPHTVQECLVHEQYRLNGVEFIVPYGAWPRDSIAPALIGQTLHREDNLKFWYLHVWAWTENPDGIVSNFHRDVACPGGAGKVYRPFVDASG